MRFSLATPFCLLTAACSGAVGPNLQEPEDDLCFSLVAANWDSISSQHERERLPEFPLRMRALVEGYDTLYAHGAPVLGSFGVTLVETRKAVFDYAATSEHASWYSPAPDSLLIGSQGPFGGFWFGGRLRGDTLAGSFQWSTDSGMHATGQGPAVAVRHSCDQPPGGGI